MSCPFFLSEAPVLDSPSMANAILEGNSAYMICNLKSATPSSEITWYDNNNQEIISDSQKYGIFKEDSMSNLTVRETEWGKDSGLYRCMASNAVGNTSLLIRLDVNSTYEFSAYTSNSRSKPGTHCKQSPVYWDYPAPSAEGEI